MGKFTYQGEKIQLRFSWLSCYQEIPQTHSLNVITLKVRSIHKPNAKISMSGAMI